MPSQMVWNGTEQKSLEARSGLSVAPSRCPSFMKEVDGGIGLAPMTDATMHPIAMDLFAKAVASVGHEAEAMTD
jgi:hypothetical protein